MNTCWIHSSRSNAAAGITGDSGRAYCEGWAELIDWGRRIRVVLVDVLTEIIHSRPVAIIPSQCCPKCTSNGARQSTKAHRPLSPMRLDELSMPHPLQKCATAGRLETC
jgi:hypothetical protein